MIEPCLMTLKQVAAYLQVHPTTINRLLKRKAIPAVSVVGDWRFPKDAIDAWIKDSLINPSPTGK